MIRNAPDRSPSQATASPRIAESGLRSRRENSTAENDPDAPPHKWTRANGFRGLSVFFCHSVNRHFSRKILRPVLKAAPSNDVQGRNGRPSGGLLHKRRRDVAIPEPFPARNPKPQSHVVHQKSEPGLPAFLNNNTRSQSAWQEIVDFLSVADDMSGLGSARSVR